MPRRLTVNNLLPEDSNRILGPKLRIRDSVRRTHNPLVYVIDRFSDHWEQIRALADLEQDFRDLCRDYAEAVELCDYWREQHEPHAPERARDYTVVVAELEAEIIREITAFDRLKTQR